MKLNIGNATVTIERPELTDAERSRREEEIKQAIKLMKEGFKDKKV